MSHRASWNRPCRLRCPRPSRNVRRGPAHD
jgi:hypothetical protein